LPVTTPTPSPDPDRPADGPEPDAAAPPEAVPDPAAAAVPGPVAWPPAGAFMIESAAPPARKRASLWGEGLSALGIAAWLTVLGFPLGWLWSAVAPWTPVQMTPDGGVLAQPEQEQMIADEGWYLLITVVAGLVIAALAWALLRRYRGAFMMVGLAVGGGFGGVLTWWFGHNLGLDHFRDLLQHAPNGANFGAPVNLRVQQVGLWHGWLPYARGDVLALAIAATALYLLLTGFSSYPSLRGPDPAPPVMPGFYPDGLPPEVPGGQVPGGQVLGGQVLGGQVLGGEVPGGEAPGGGQPPVESRAQPPSNGAGLGAGAGLPGPVPLSSDS
jgi:hypothetical protein